MTISCSKYGSENNKSAVWPPSLVYFHISSLVDLLDAFCWWVDEYMLMIF